MTGEILLGLVSFGSAPAMALVISLRSRCPLRELFGPWAVAAGGWAAVDLATGAPLAGTAGCAVSALAALLLWRRATRKGERP